MAGIQLVQAGGAGTLNAGGTQNPTPFTGVLTGLSCVLAVTGTTPTTYAWALAVPPGSTATLSTTTGASPTFTPDRAGNYAVVLTDNTGAVYTLQLAPVSQVAGTAYTGPLAPAYLTPSQVATPAAGESLFCDSTNGGKPSSKDAAGTIWELAKNPSGAGFTSGFNTLVAGTSGSGRVLDVSAAFVAALRPGAAFWVASVKDYVRWISTSSATHDGITVINPTANGANPGRFIRQMAAAPEWMDQLTWIIDPSAGTSNDENDGLTAATALLTDAERQRRMGPNAFWRAGQYHLRWLSDLPAGDPVRIVGIRNSASSIVGHGSMTNGQGKTSLYSGTIDSLVAENVGAQQQWSITSNALPTSWTASGLIGQRLRLTSGANTGGISWVTHQHATPKRADFAEFKVAGTFTGSLPATWASIVPAQTDTFVVESLVSVPLFTYQVTAIDDGSVNTHTCASSFDSLALGSSNFTVCANDSKFTTFDGCTVTLGPVVGMGSIDFVGVKFAGSGFFAGWSSVKVIQGYTAVDLSTGLAKNVSINSNFMIDGGFGLFAAYGIVDISNVALFRCVGDGLTVLSGAAVRVSGTIWGNGNVGTGIKVNSGAQLTYSPTKPTVTGASDTTVGGTVKAYASIPYIEPTNNAMIVVSA